MTTFGKIYAVVNLIPAGKVTTYKQIAQKVGVKNPRIVGFAMHANKKLHIVPCHRVVGSNGKLTGYAMGGIQKKKELLVQEGVLFIGKDKVDLNRSLYHFS